jgi:hypothetical protein
LVLRMFRGVVSVVVLGVNLLSLGSLDEHSTAIFLDLLAVELHGELLRLGGLVLDGGEGGGFQRSAVYGRLPFLVHLHVVLLGHGARVLGGGEGGGELLVVDGEGGGGGKLLVVGGEGGGGGDLLVIGGEGGGGGELLVHFVFDPTFASLHFTSFCTAFLWPNFNLFQTNGF